MKVLVLLIFLCCSGTLGAQTAQQRQKHYNLAHGVALQGYDPISYFTGRPARGSKIYRYQYQGVEYHFENMAHLDEFKRNPGGYEPQYGGWCAYAMGTKGEKVEIDPETFKITGNKLYLFYNKYFNNTLKSWNKDELKLRARADVNWSRFK